VLECCERPVLFSVGRREQQQLQQLAHMRPVERTLGHRVIAQCVDHRIERSPHQPARPLEIGRNVHDRSSARDRQLDHLAGAATTARLEPVPNCNEQITMRDRRPAGDHISVERAAPVAGKLQHALALAEQGIETLERAIARKLLAVGVAVERKHGVKLVAEVERAFGGDLVGAVGKRRHEL